LIRSKLLTVSGDTGLYIGEVEYTEPTDEVIFTVPLGIRRIHAVAVGGGGYRNGANGGQGGGGGGLAWANNIEVEPGEKISVRVGSVASNSSFNKDGKSGLYRPELDEDGNPVLDYRDDPIRHYIIAAYGGESTTGRGGEPEWADTGIGDHGGGTGGDGTWADPNQGGGGGGAAGYDGNGGRGSGGPPEAGSGGGSGGTNGEYMGFTTYGGTGGGVGIKGRGADGTPVTGYGKDGRPGSGGSGSEYGGGTGNADWTEASGGAVRIIWGIRFSYPDNADIEAVE
jgi:hypothetical protein